MLDKKISRGQFLKILVSSLASIALLPFSGRPFSIARAQGGQFNGRPARGIKGAYDLVVTRGGVFPLRAGYQNVPTLLANYLYNGQTQQYDPGDQVKGTGFSVGTGFISNSIALDLTYSRIRYEQTYSMNGATMLTSQYTEQAITGSLIVYF